ncbi:MAG TPA: hypothetical protein DCG12_04785, partial [Planctomycetaceae bacterium]|nr:hypothetical protein [Planctomycetaceae bacterium]
MRSFKFAICVALALCVPATAQFPKSTKVARFDRIVSKAVGYLTGSKPSEREKTLVAYALLKAGAPTNHEMVAEGINIALGRARGNGYGRAGYDHIYLAGVDAMLLADSDGGFTAELQNIANYVSSVQKPDGSWSDAANRAGDVSMSQYGVLALWSAQRAGCTVSAASVDRAASFFISKRNGDGGWGYRPGTKEGPGKGNSTHNMVVAGAGSVAVGRTMFYGPRNQEKKEKQNTSKGPLKRVVSEEEKAAEKGSAFPNHKPQFSQSAMDDTINRALAWNQTRFQPVSRAEHKIYYYYALERTAALADLQEGWFETYGDGLATLQGEKGEFHTHSGPSVGTSFAILYYMRSTKQILDKQYGSGSLTGDRGLDNLFGKKKVRRDRQGLDVLLDGIEGSLEQLDALDENLDTEEIVESVQFGDIEELVGQADKLKLLMKSKDAGHRGLAYYALGRTGDFSLVPEMMQGLRDPNIDVNVNALQALRYISRKPNGFGMTLDPARGLRSVPEQERVQKVNYWRTQAYEKWMTWYRTVRPYEDTGGLDELDALSGK